MTTFEHGGSDTGAGAAFAGTIATEVAKTVVGQQVVVERVLIALLTGGHLLLEGVPGTCQDPPGHRPLEKQWISSSSACSSQSTLLPSDIVGSEILDPESGDFRVHKGPVFTNLLLADEINRASPKVQSALLEAMQERKATIGDTTHELPAPFLVIATQNPVEQAGTFELPEAQLDRFMLRHRLDYPTMEQETEVVTRGLALKLKRQGDGAVPMTAFDAINTQSPLKVKDLTAAMEEVLRVHVSEVFIRDCVELVTLTRSHPEIELGMQSTRRHCTGAGISCSCLRTRP